MCESEKRQTELYLLMEDVTVCLKILSLYQQSYKDLVVKDVTIRIKGGSNLKERKALMVVTPEQLSELRSNKNFQKWLKEDKVVILRKQPRSNQIRTVKSFRNQILNEGDEKMSNPKKYSWYIQPLDEYTNRCVCDQFNIGQNDDRLKIGQPVNMGKNKVSKVNLIKISTDQKNILVKKAVKLGFRFNLFSQQGKGQIRFVMNKWVAGKPVYSNINEGVSFDNV